MRKPNASTSPNRSSKMISEFSPETKIRQIKKFLHSPLSKKKLSICHKSFGVVLAKLVSKQPEHEVPFVVKRICKYLEEAGLKHEGIFRVSGNAKTIESLRMKFDETGDANLEEEADIFSAACLLKLFLRELPDPVIPSLLSRHFIEAHQENRDDVQSNIKHLMKLVWLLPEEHYNLLKYLIEFLLKVIKHHEFNKMTSVGLGVVFGPNIFRISCGLEGLNAQAESNEIVTAFVDHFNQIFNKSNMYVLSHATMSRTTMPSVYLDMIASYCKLPEDKPSENPDIQYKRMQRAVRYYLSTNKAKKLQEMPSTSQVKSFDCREGPGIVYKLSNSTGRDKLKRSKSHIEMTALNNNACFQLADVTAPVEQPRQPQITHSLSLDTDGVEDDENVKADNQQILSYDSDESHELRRRAERQLQFGGKRYRKKSSTKRSRISKSASPVKQFGSRRKYSADLSHEIDADEENSQSLSSEFSKLLANTDRDSVVPCPRTYHLRQSWSDFHLERDRIEARRNENYALDDLQGEKKTAKRSVVKGLKSKFKILRKKVKSFEWKGKLSNSDDDQPSSLAHDDNGNEIGSSDDHSSSQTRNGSGKQSSEPIAVPVSDRVYAAKYGSAKPCIEDTVCHLKRMIDEDRINSKRPEALQKMNRQQIHSEKFSIQKALLHLEAVHGRSSHVFSNSFVKALYERYRAIKRITNKCPSPTCSKMAVANNDSLVPITEDQTMQFTHSPLPVKSKKKSSKSPRRHFERSIRTHDCKEAEDLEAAGKYNEKYPTMNFDNTRYNNLPSVLKLVAMSEPQHPADGGGGRLYDQSHLPSGPGTISEEVCDESALQIRRSSDPRQSSDWPLPSGNLNEMSSAELMEVYRVTYDRKMELNEQIGTFESKFRQKYARKVSKKDRGHMESVYSEYKELKAKLKLVGALITKKQAEKIATTKPF